MKYVEPSLCFLLLFIGGCSPVIENQKRANPDSVKVEVHALPELTEIDFGADELECVVTIPNHQFDHPKFGSQTTTDRYRTFKRNLGALTGYRLPVLANHANARTSENPKQDFYIIVPSHLDCFTTEIAIKRIHQKYYHPKELIFDVSTDENYVRILDLGFK